MSDFGKTDFGALERMPWPLPGLDTLTAINRATVFRPRCGNRPAYTTMADAMEYERGYAAWPNDDGIEPNTPASRGWYDRDRIVTLREEARDDEAWEKRQ